MAAGAARTRPRPSARARRRLPAAAGALELRGKLAGPFAYLRAAGAAAVGAVSATERSHSAPSSWPSIDLEQCPETITAAPDYEALWALVREPGRPRGMIRIPFEDGAAERAALTARDRRAARPPPSARAARPPGGVLPSISVVIPSMLERMDGLQVVPALAGRARLSRLRGDRRRQPPGGLAARRGRRRARRARDRAPGSRRRATAVWTARRGEIIAFTDDDVRRRTRLAAGDRTAASRITRGGVRHRAGAAL